MVGLRRHRRLERQQPAPPPGPPDDEAEARPAEGSTPADTASSRPPIALVPDPPDRVFDQDEPTEDPTDAPVAEASGQSAESRPPQPASTSMPSGAAGEPGSTKADAAEELAPGAPVMTVVETEVVEIEIDQSEIDEIDDAELVDEEAEDAEAGVREGAVTEAPVTESGDAESDDAEPVAAEPVEAEPGEAELEAEAPAVAAADGAAAGEDDTETEDRAEAPASATATRIPIPRPGLNEGPILDPETLPDAATTEAATFELPRVIAIANQKGGVGKTTTAVNLGAALAELEFRVLVLDLDPQGNATTGLGINPRDVESSVYDVLLNDVALEDVVEPTTLRNLFVAPATIDLAGAEIELVPAMSRELRLKRAIDQVRPDYDLVLIDCPPSLGLLTVNGLAAADDVIVPIQCEYYALEGLGQLLRNVGLVQSNLNQSLEVRGIILTMYDARTKLADQVESEVRNYFGPKVYRTVVPRTVRLSEAPSFGQPIIVFDPTSRGASAYRELAKEVSRGATKRAR
jgi:chromosome partitioning protein